MLILDGKEVSKVVRASLVPRVQSFKERTGRVPHLTVVIVGDDKASHVYVQNKKKACEAIGMTSTVYELQANTTQQELNNLLIQLNNNDGVDGVLVQLPLPKHLSSEQVLEILNSEKDPDALTFKSLGYFFAGKPVVSPCTPSGIMTIL